MQSSLDRAWPLDRIPGLPGGAADYPQTAPLAADPTSLTYLASTPVL